MYTFIRFYTLKFLSIVFYIVGDIACRIPTEFTANIYQKAMCTSFDLDEKIGFQIWKEK
jgi:hypothetical protein